MGVDSNPPQTIQQIRDRRAKPDLQIRDGHGYLVPSLPDTEEEVHHPLRIGEVTVEFAVDDHAHQREFLLASAHALTRRTQLAKVVLHGEAGHSLSP